MSTQVTVTRTVSVRRQAPIAIYAGIAMAALGFLLLALAWNGAASLDYIQGQFPYLVSGGLLGLSLIVIGSAVMVIQALRQEAEERAAQLDELNATVLQLVAVLSPPDEYDPAVAGEFRPRPRVSGNGTAPAPASAGVWEEPA